MNISKHTGAGSPSLALFVTSASSFMTAFMGSSLNIAIPVISLDFGITAYAASWISSIYLLATAVFLIPVGRLSDRYGRVVFFRIGIILFSAASLLSVFSSSLLSLLIFRIFQGIGSAFLFSTAAAIVVSIYPPEKRGKALGIITASVYTGLSSGPFLGGIITHRAGWESIFLITALIGFVILLPLAFYLTRENVDKIFAHFRFRSFFLLSISILFVLFGFSAAPRLIGFVFLAAGILGWALFYFDQKNSNVQIINFNLISRNKTFRNSNLAALINYSATFAVGFLLSFYFQTVKGLTPESAGIILIIQPVLQALFSPLAGRLSDRIEPGVVASIGMAVIAAGLTGLIFIGPETPNIILMLILSILGFGFAMFSSPNANAIMSSVEKRDYGLASAVMAEMRLIGQAFSMGLVMIIFTIFIGESKVDPSAADSFLLSSRIAFSLFAVLCLPGIYLSVRRGSLHEKREIQTEDK